MQIDQFSSYKAGTGYDTVEAPFVKKASNKMFMSPEIETKGMQSNGSFSKLRPDSSQSFDVGSNKQSHGMKSPSFHERAEQPQSTYPSYQRTFKLVHYLKPGIITLYDPKPILPKIVRSQLRQLLIPTNKDGSFNLTKPASNIKIEPEITKPETFVICKKTSFIT